MKPTIRPRYRTAFLVSAGALVVMGIATGALLVAARHVPAFYRQALVADAAVLRRGNDELLESATALVNTARHEGQWYALLTEEQINGWLSIDLVQNHRALLPANVVDLRAHFEPGRAMIACEYRYPGLSTVVSVKFDVYLSEPNVVALRIHGARAGSLPVPMTPIVEGVANAAEQLNLRVQWRQAHGDPVALITLPAAHTETSVYRLDALQLRDRAIYLAGRTESPSSPGSPTSPAVEPLTGMARLPEEKRKVH